MNPFFAFQTHAAGTPATPPWRPLSELVDPDDPALAARIAAVRAHLATAANRSADTIPLRVAASVTHLGLTARLLSPALHLTVTTGQVPDLTLATTWYQPTLASTFPLSLPAVPGTPAETFRRHILEGPIAALVDATRRYSVSPKILWGNVASALHAATTQLPPKATPLTQSLLTHPPLHNTWTSTPVFRRRTCCLIYQAARQGTPPSLCADCVLNAPRANRP
ncbi:MAG: IucA/IucC family C-terminal-domain containing protein [Mycobacteriales bacterium]